MWCCVGLNSTTPLSDTPRLSETVIALLYLPSVLPDLCPPMQQAEGALAPLSARFPQAEHVCSPVERVRVCPSAVQQSAGEWQFLWPSSLSPACTRRYSRGKRRFLFCAAAAP